MAPFKDEHLLIISPGSQTTLAQVGLPEAFTPPRVRIKSRMFPTDVPGKYEPYRIRPKPRQAPPPNGTSGAASSDEQPPSADNGVTKGDVTNGETSNDEMQTAEGMPEDDDEGATLEEDPISDSGAVWPIQAGRIVDWPAFFALMQHLHNMLGGGFHTPIMLIAQPVWTPVEHIRITRFFFEKFKCPAFALMDSAQALCYAYGVPSACVIDIGRDKADVTAVSDFLTTTVNRGIAIPNLGGEAMTQHLLAQLKTEGWGREMCEQLKYSSICEILPAEVPIPGSKEALQSDTKTLEKPANPAAAASTGADGSGANQRHSAGATGDAPRGPGRDVEGRPAEVGEEDNEGVIDVASIVAGGKTNEYLAQKEKEKKEKAAAAAAKRKGDAAWAAQNKAVRLKNSEREFNSFVYDDKTSRDQEKDEEAVTEANGRDETVQATPAAAQPPAPVAPTEAQQQPPAIDTSMSGTSVSQAPSAVPPSSVSTSAPDLTSPTTTTKEKIPSNPYTRTLTVGPARFRPLPEAYLPALTSAVHMAIQAVPTPNARQTVWDHILITGQGARVRGFKDALLTALSARFLISPSSASIFTSEPPSSFGTPGGTGANTPLPSGQSSLPAFTPGPPPGLAAPQGGVNPLLYAATTANAAGAPAALGYRPPHAGMGTPAAAPAGQLGTPPGARLGGTPAPQPFRGATPVGGSGTPAPVPAAARHAHSGGTSQTPTSVRPGKLPDYFGEWKDPAAEFGAVFLGAQVAAKCIFLADVQGGSNKGFMSRSDYNEQGPSAIAEFSL